MGTAGTFLLSLSPGRPAPCSELSHVATRPLRGQSGEWGVEGAGRVKESRFRCCCHLTGSSWRGTAARDPVPLPQPHASALKFILNRRYGEIKALGESLEGGAASLWTCHLGSPGTQPQHRPLDLCGLIENAFVPALGNLHSSPISSLHTSSETCPLPS